MTNQLPTATLLVTKSHQDVAEQIAFEQLAERLSTRLKQPVVPFPIDQRQQSLTDILTGLLRHGVARIITLPTFLNPADYRAYAVAETVDQVNRRWPFVQHHVCPPLDWDAWLGLVEAMIEGASDAAEPASPEETAVILVGHGNAGPETNSDIAKLSRLFYEAHDYGWVDVAFASGVEGSAVTPSVGNLIPRYRLLGAKRIIVVPYLLFDGQIVQHLQAQVEAATAASQLTIDSCQLSIVNSPPLSSHTALVDLLLSQHETALADTSLLPQTREALEAEIWAARAALDAEQPDQPPAEVDEFQQMKSKIDAILPPRYQGRTDEISAAPMSAADLVFDEGGAVLWDQIFGVDDPNNPYCELALAGGPSHRGELLEAVSREACLAEPGRYAAALEECGRGINMITGMEIVQSPAPGWIGVLCDSEEMAVWLMRAIIVENVMVRRQRETIFLPVGPHYTLKDQIKSIVTVTAKTWHYWIEHITYQVMFRTRQESVNKQTLTV